MTQPDPSAQSGTGNAQSGVTDNGQGTGANQDPNAQSGVGGQGGAQEQQTPPAPAMVTQADYDALKSRLQAADQQRTKVENDLRQLLDKDLPEQEKLKKDFAEAAAARDKATAELRQARIENAFLTDNKYKWKNPRTALKLADLSRIEVNDDGTVTNLTSALDALAKSDPYLIDVEVPTEDPPKGSTGAPAGGRAAAANADLKGLADRIPALRTRGIGR